MSERIIGARVELFLVNDKGEERTEEMFNAKGNHVSVSWNEKLDIGTVRSADEPYDFHYHTGGKHLVLRVDVNAPDTGPKP